MTKFIKTQYGEFLDLEKAFRIWVKTFPVEVEDVQKIVYYVKADFLVSINIDSSSDKVFDTLTTDIAEFDSDDKAKRFLNKLLVGTVTFVDTANYMEAQNEQKR